MYVYEGGGYCITRSPKYSQSQSGEAGSTNYYLTHAPSPPTRIWFLGSRRSLLGANAAKESLLHHFLLPFLDPERSQNINFLCQIQYGPPADFLKLAAEDDLLAALVPNKEPREPKNEASPKEIVPPDFNMSAGGRFEHGLLFVLLGLLFRLSAFLVGRQRG